MKYYKISEKELEGLLASQLELNQLQWSGVDNWSWYGEGYGDFMKEKASEYLTKEEIEEKTNELIDSTFVADLILNSGRYEEIKCD